MTHSARLRRRLDRLYAERAALLGRLTHWVERRARYHDLQARLRALTQEALRLETTLKGKAR